MSSAKKECGCPCHHHGTVLHDMGETYDVIVDTVASAPFSAAKLR